MRYTTHVPEKQHSREYLIGRRLPDGPARLFIPDAAFVPHEVSELPESIWNNQRRMVRMDFLNNKEASLLLTLFIPLASTEPPLLFETVHLMGDVGWIMFRAETVEQARQNHERASRMLKQRFRIADAGSPGG